MLLELDDDGKVLLELDEGEVLLELDDDGKVLLELDDGELLLELDDDGKKLLELDEELLLRLEEEDEGLEDEELIFLSLPKSEWRPLPSLSASKAL